MLKPINIPMTSLYNPQIKQKAYLFVVTLKSVRWKILLLWYWKALWHQQENLHNTGWGVHVSSTNIHIGIQEIEYITDK